MSPGERSDCPRRKRRCVARISLARGGRVCGGVLGPLLLMEGLGETSAANGSLLLNLEGLMTMAIAWLVFRENVDARLLAGAGRHSRSARASCHGRGGAWRSTGARC